MIDANRSTKLLLLFLTLVFPALAGGASASYPLGLTVFESTVLPIALVVAATHIIHQESVALPSLTGLILTCLASFFLSNTLLAPCCCFRGQGQLTGCKSNFKNIACALEMYTVDHGGKYPRKLADLTPNYMRNIPHCPSAQKDTYSGGYRSTNKPDAYPFYCRGCHHHNAGIDSPNFPQYSSSRGLILP